MDEGFEDGGLLFSDPVPGKWTAEFQRVSSPTQVDPNAARTGANGFSVLDNDATNNDGSSGLIHHRISGSIGPRLYLRFWLRMSGPPVVSTVIPSNIHMDGGDVLFDLRVDTTAGRVSVGGFDRFGAYSISPSNQYIGDGGWHQVELLADGMGSSQASRHVMVNGVDAGRQPTDWTGLAYGSYELGQPWGQPRIWTGQLSFDDIRASPFVLPAAVSVRIPGGLTESECGALDLVLHNSFDGALTPPLEDTLVTVISVPVVDFFADPSCATASSGRVVFAADAGAARLYLRPRTFGDHGWYASSAGLRDGAAFATVLPAPDAGTRDAGVPDAGLPDAGGADAGVGDAGAAAPDASVISDAGAGSLGDARELGVGCGCAGAPQLLWGVTLALLLCGARRRRSKLRNS